MKHFVALAASLLFACVQADDLNIYAGALQALPIEVKGEWSLETANGRMVKNGVADGQLTIELPALDEDVPSQNFVFSVAGVKHKLVAHNPKLFSGSCRIGFDLPFSLEKQLKDAGFVNSERAKARDSIAFIEHGGKAAGRLNFVFSSASSFPLAIPDGWASITLLKAKFPGRFSLVADKAGQALDLNGSASCLLVEDANGVKSFFLPHNIKLDQVETMLFIKNAIQSEVLKWER